MEYKFEYKIGQEVVLRLANTIGLVSAIYINGTTIIYEVRAFINSDFRTVSAQSFELTAKDSTAQQSAGFKIDK